MTRILTLIGDDHGLNARLQAALDLTKAAEGHLTCLDLTIPISPLLVDPAFGSIVMEPPGRSKARTAARHRVESSGVPHAIVERTGALLPELAKLASHADWVVLSTPRGVPECDMRTAIGRTLVRGGAAVFVIPATLPGLKLSGEALLLWDGSPEARHAMAAAMPLLRKAAMVTILEVDDGKLGVPACEAANHLTERGIRNEVRTMSAFGESATDRILDTIGLRCPGYAVMGGFGTPPLVERLFGGVTERLLHDSQIPLFLKH